MTLTEKKAIILNALRTLEQFRYEHYSDAQNGNQTRFKNVQFLNKAYQILNSLPNMSNPLDFVSQTEISGFMGTDYIVKRDVGNQIVLNVVDAREKLSFALQLMEELIPSYPEHTIYIKIAEPANMQQLHANIAKIQKALEPVVTHPSIAGAMKFEGVEPGTTWVMICLEVAAAVSVVGGIMTAAIKMAKQFQLLRYQETIIKKAETEAAAKETMLDYSKKMMDLLIDAESQELHKNYIAEDESKRPETILRLSHAVKTMMEEISKGAAITPRIEDSKDVKQHFPDMALLESIVERKLIDKTE